MRIDFVITELFVGGAEKCLTELAIAMAAQGDSVRVFSLGSLPDGEQTSLVERLRNAEIDVESLKADSAWKYHQAFRELRERLWDNPPDVLQSFLHHANVLGIHAAAAAGIGVRVAGVRVAQPRPIRSQIEKIALRQAQSVVCVSRSVERFALQKLGCRESSTIVIPNGVDIERFELAAAADWTQLGWPADAAVSLFVGRLDAQKGIELLQREINRVAPPDSPRKLLLVGDGPLKGSLERWCEEIGSDRVCLLPWQSDVAPWMRACRLLVLPSRYEGMPNVVLEAMAASKPVVCSLVEGSEELLSHAAEQQGFDSGDSSQMAFLIEQFLSDEKRCEEVGHLNRMRVESDFSLAAMTEAYRLHYLRLLDRRRDDS